MKNPFIIVLVRKNKEKFVNWYCRLPKEDRLFITAAYLSFYEDRGIDPNLPLLENRKQVAAFLFEEFQTWSVRQFVFYPNLREVVLLYHPFIYSEGPSTYLHREEIDSRYIND